MDDGSSNSTRGTWKIVMRDDEEQRRRKESVEKCQQLACACAFEERTVTKEGAGEGGNA